MGLLGAGVYYGMTVKLGERTFFEHVRAIGTPRKPRSFGRGTTQKVGGLVDEATDKVVKGVSKNAPGKVLMRGDGMGADQKRSRPNPAGKTLASGSQGVAQHHRAGSHQAERVRRPSLVVLGLLLWKRTVSTIG